MLIVLLAKAQDNKYLPYTENTQIITEQNYIIDYSSVDKQAIWVVYELTSNEVKGGYGRTNNFRPNPQIHTQQAQLSDYKGSGYDRGHLAPAGDMTFSNIAMSESFYLSNMSPQTISFNRGIWKKLESQVRTWALLYDTVYVVTGPILNKVGIIGNGVTIPESYYKLVLRQKENQIDIIAFILPNVGSKKSLSSFATTVDRVEQQTGIDFFPQLDDELENNLERKLNISAWDFTTKVSVQHQSNNKNKTANQRCQARTTKGTQCKRNAQEGSKFCWQHQ